MSEVAKSECKFRKVLVGRYSPQNECFAAEGAVLYAPLPLEGKVARHGATHYFVSTQDCSKMSKFGWVKSVDEFEVNEFLKKYAIESSASQIQVLCDLFVAISNLADGTPVAATYFNRGVEHRRPELSFHRVFLYPEKGATQNKLKKVP